MKLLKPLLLILSAFSFFACGGSKPLDPLPTKTPVTAESSLCSTSTTYASAVTITGTATFYKRGLDVTQSGGAVAQMTLGAPISTPLPIKFAEIQVLDSAGNLVQCGKTDSVGALKALDGTSALTISNAAGSYTVQVLSRSNQTLTVPMGKTEFKFLTSIKSDLYSNSVYKITKSITSIGSGSISASLIAYARESESSEILGGAFNIYNSLLTTYEYLAQNTGTSNLICMSSKLDVYWKQGFNPAQYIYPSEDPSTLGTVSFYVHGDKQLFINGGLLGNVTTKDTDHFDDAVIIHELGHYVEDVCGKMDSTGGTHYGLYRIDPRLSWSEGWGNFFGAHMIRNNLAKLNSDLAANLPASGWLHYLDTEGYNDGAVTSGVSLILLNLTKAGSNPESVNTSQGVRSYDKVNATLYPGEGHTREVSIARSLFKGTNTCTTLCSNTNYFAYYWLAFENDITGIGMGKPNYPFRSSARFYNRLNQAFVNASTTTPASIDSILNTDEAQQRNGNSNYVVGGSLIWPPYAVRLTNNGATPCTNSLKIQPRQDSASVTDSLSDQRYSNHFYLIDLSILPGITEINLTATKNAGTSTDIDLILYNEGYKFTEDCGAYDTGGNCITFQKKTASDMARSDRRVASTTSTSFTKQLTTISSLNSSSYYLLDVRAYTAGQTILGTTDYTYTLKDQTGAYLCPSTTY
jgi:hypothetical protein